MATCAQHHEGRTGRMHFTPPGLAPEAGPTAWPQRLEPVCACVCTHPLTRGRQRGGSAEGSRGESGVKCAIFRVARPGGSRGARPGSASTGPLSAGPASALTHTHTHTHTGSARHSIAPHGRARPRAVTQMALGDFRMTHRPPSALCPPRGDQEIRADERSAPRGCGCITRRT